MLIEIKKQITIQDNNNGRQYTIDAADLDWEHVATEERNMGAEYTYEIRIHHSNLAEIVITLYEYPEGAKNHVDAPDGITVIKEPEFVWG